MFDLFAVALVTEAVSFSMIWIKHYAFLFVTSFLKNMIWNSNTRISQSFSVVPWTLRYQYLPAHNIIASYDKKAYQFYARMHIKDEEFPNISFVVPNKSDLDKCLQSLVHNDVFKFI